MMPQARMPTGLPNSQQWMPPPPPSQAPPGVPPLPPPGIAQTHPRGGGGTSSSGSSIAEHLVGLPATYEALMPALGRHVAPMLAATTRASEQRVSTEIRRLEQGLSSLSSKVSKVEALLEARDPNARSMQKGTLVAMLLNVEQRWEEEIKDVKRELHQTILAHNHNADLMADHKSTIDGIRAQVEDYKPALHPEAERQVREHLAKLLQALGAGQAKDQEIDCLLRRGEALMQNLAAMGIALPMRMGGPVPTAQVPMAHYPVPYRPGQPYPPGYGSVAL
eukprot:gnl/TRDRNA2_/TRDRNA2_201060_c0_seq1.p1 gnl/TRDRNA2_/TRDRNA2_201060_c0~~gnl/TRDRNA2_/TRDRNA2_201060_c0_seq1.p1  ORF type:complete len:288 (-),score=58.43 gnl/TRDRNA2_/TRDRNA2_201060_c0_seq1:74-907(-)